MKIVNQWAMLHPAPLQEVTGKNMRTTNKTSSKQTDRQTGRKIQTHGQVDMKTYRLSDWLTD